MHVAYIRLWLGPALSAMWCVMYFRFWWRHVFT